MTAPGAADFSAWTSCPASVTAGELVGQPTGGAVPDCWASAAGLGEASGDALGDVEGAGVARFATGADWPGPHARARSIAAAAGRRTRFTGHLAARPAPSRRAAARIPAAAAQQALVG